MQHQKRNYFQSILEQRTLLAYNYAAKHNVPFKKSLKGLVKRLSLYTVLKDWV